jgi:mannose-6-phosphate isomerase-like protein (cupin superfamily)
VPAPHHLNTKDTAMHPVNIHEKFALFTEHWSPKIVGALNGQHVKLARLRGDFPWHAHEQEDELFFVVRGSLLLEFRDQTVTMSENEFLIVPRGVEHRPVAKEEVWVMLFEPESTVNTGTLRDARTLDRLEWI